MKNIRFAIIALVVTLAALSTSAAAQTKSGIGACFDIEGGTASVSLGGKVKTDFSFENVPFLLELEDYGTNKTVTAYGKFQAKSDQVNQVGVFDYSYIPFLTSCGKKDGLVAALKQAFPDYKVKFATEKGKVQQVKDGAQKTKDTTVEGAKKIWGKLSKKP